MLSYSKTTMHLETLEMTVLDAGRLTASLMADVISQRCTRLPAPDAARLHHLMEREAWMDAVLTLITLEIPQWKLRRLIFDDGCWLCSLSKQPLIPIEIDDTIDAAHKVLEIALLRAFMDAQQRSAAAPVLNARPLPRAVQSPCDYVICTDNFA